MVSKGFRDAGYKIVWIDDCWALRNRTTAGVLVPDPSRWPNGMKAVADYVHSQGMMLGLYGDIGAADAVAAVEIRQSPPRIGVTASSSSSSTVFQRPQSPDLLPIL
jgi:hypothetical protein